MLSLGVRFLTVTSAGAGAKTWHLYAGEYEHGTNLVHALEDYVKDYPVELMKETPAKEIIMEDGKVAGIAVYRHMVHDRVPAPRAEFQVQFV